MVMAIGCACFAFVFSACGKKKTVDPKTLFSNAEDLTFDNKSVEFPTPFTAKLFDNGTAENSFAVSYTVEGGNTNIDGYSPWYWVNTGGLYVEQADGTWHNIIIYQYPNNEAVVRDASAVIWIIEGKGEQKFSEGAYFKTTLPFAVSNYPMEVQVAYYQEAYYLRLENTYSVKIDVNSDFTDSVKIDTNKFFASGARKIGFRTAETSAKFSDISFDLGDEATLKAIENMKLSV
jgi:hypothetical protein